jgi:hypothetical protein
LFRDGAALGPKDVDQFLVLVAARKTGAGTISVSQPNAQDIRIDGQLDIGKHQGTAVGNAVIRITASTMVQGANDFSRSANLRSGRIGVGDGWPLDEAACIQVPPNRIPGDPELASDLPYRDFLLMQVEGLVDNTAGKVLVPAKTS